MKKMKFMLSSVLLVTSFSGFAQMLGRSDNPKLIAVVNKANWCAVCKANATRFGNVLMPYAAKGVNIYLNDLTDETTKAASKQELEKVDAFVAVNSIPRQGIGKVLKACRLVNDKAQTQDVTGIVTFINPKTHKQVKQISIAESDEVIIKSINNLLN